MTALGSKPAVNIRTLHGRAIAGALAFAVAIGVTLGIIFAIGGDSSPVTGGLAPLGPGSDVPPGTVQIEPGDTPPPGGDTGAIPPRGWLLGNIFCRGYISSLMADGGVGKTALRIAQCLELARGKSLTGDHVFQRCRVLFITLEDDLNELRRRARAARPPPPPRSSPGSRRPAVSRWSSR